SRWRGRRGRRAGRRWGSSGSRGAGSGGAGKIRGRRIALFRNAPASSLDGRLFHDALDMPVATRFLLLLLLAPLAPVSAQQVGTCAPGTAEKVLDINDVRAHVFNGGNLFFGNVTTSGDGYLVPKATGNSPIFASSLWIGGKVDGELRMAGATYYNFEFWPGPLDEEGNPPEDCTPYDRIYRVSRGDVARYYATGEMTDDLRDWPAHLG